MAAVRAKWPERVEVPAIRSLDSRGLRGWRAQGRAAQLGVEGRAVPLGAAERPA